MVVFLQELKVKSISDLTLQDGGELDEPLFDSDASLLLVVLDSLLNELKDFVLIGLLFFITDIECNLVSVKILISVFLNQFF